VTLAPLSLPAADGWLRWADEYTASSFAEYRARIAELKDGTGRSGLEVLGLLNDASIALGNGLAPASLIAEVHPDERVRTLLEERGREGTALATAQGQDAELFAVLEPLDPAELDDAARRVLERTLRDFRLSGVGLPEEQRRRFAEIADRLVELDQEFSRRARDDVRSIRIRPEQLDGLPDDFRAAHPADADGLVSITTDYPDAVPFRTFATDAAARYGLTLAFQNRAWPENDGVLAEILELRAEQAALVGSPRGPTTTRSARWSAPPPVSKSSSPASPTRRASPRHPTTRSSSTRCASSTPRPPPSTTRRRCSRGSGFGASASPSTARRRARTSTRTRCARACWQSSRGCSA
jgi:thimet oligopeptidase